MKRGIVMQVYCGIILAAGSGTRISRHIGNRPKSLIEIAGRSILSRQIEGFRSIGIDEVVVVLGYRASLIQKHIECLGSLALKVKFVLNEDYRITDNSWSLKLGLSDLGNADGVIILDGDLIFDNELLASLMKTYPSCCIVDDSRKSVAEDAKARICDGYVLAIGKGVQSGPIYTSMIKLRGKLLSDFKKELITKESRHQWYSEPLTRALAKNPRSLIPLAARPYRVREIDTLEDLLAAEQLFRWSPLPAI